MAATLEALADDSALFAERVLGAPLWPHQIELAHSSAETRVVCAGRQVGKSRVLAVEALHTAATRRNALVLVVSGGETAAQRLLEEAAVLAAGSPLGGSVLDESKSLLTFSNGSRILSVPASQRQIRGWAVDLLIVDEAGFVPEEIWAAAEPTIIARPGSRVILASTPWGDVDHFFRRNFNRGVEAPDSEVAAFHWPSTLSPNANQARLRRIAAEEPERYAIEYLAEFADSSGAYFNEAELMAAVADYELLTPAAALQSGRFVNGPGYIRSLPAAIGVDWGYARDANAIAVVAPLEDHGANAERLGPDGLALYVSWLEAESRWAWTEFIDRIVETARSYRVGVIASETNGVGAYPTDDLQSRLHALHYELGWVTVQKVWTDVRRKQSGFGKMKGLMQSGRLVLPRHPELLKQLRGLQFEQLTGGSLRISVPESAGHDDLALALMQAVSCVYPDYLRRTAQPLPSMAETVRTGAGLLVPRRALPSLDANAFWAMAAEGAEKGDVW